MATNSTDVVMSQPKRKRAPQCSELDNPEIRAVIEFRYGIERRKLDEVVKEINETYNLTATKYQYRDRLNKWGCKQRLNKHEYHQVYHDISARKALGKQYSVFLDGTIEVDRKRVDRWISRNITFTEKYFPRQTPSTSQGLQVARRTHGLVRSPPPNRDDCLVPVIKRKVDVFSLNLPLRKFQSAIEEHFPRYRRYIENSDSKVTEGLQILELILYRISNDIYDYDPEGEVERLFEEAGESGLKDYFKQLLLVKSPYLAAARLPLATFFYLRKEDELLKSMQLDLPQLVQRIYVAFRALIRYGPGRGHKQRAKGRTMADILSDLSAVHEHESASPKSIEEAYHLLLSCEKEKEYFSVFFKLWDPTKISVEDLESYREQPEFHSLCRAPLHTKCVSQLKLLLEYGFSEYIYTVFLEAIAYDRHEMVQFLGEKLQIAFYHTDMIPAHENSTPEHAWERFDSATLYNLASKCISEIRVGNKPYHEGYWGDLDAEDHLFMHIACTQPSMVKYVVDSFAQKYSVPAETAALMAINEIPHYRTMLTSYFANENSKRALVLETLLREYKIDPNITDFWKYNTWHQLSFGPDYENDDFGSTGEELLEIMLKFGADLNGLWERHIGDEEVEERRSRFFCGRLNSSNEDKWESPLEVAFQHDISDGFCYLLGEKNVKTDRLHKLLTLEGRSDVNPEFIRALEDRDVDAIAGCWQARVGADFELFSIKQAVAAGDSDTVKSLILNIDSSLKRIKVAFEYAGIASVLKERGSEIGYEILEFVLELGVDLSREPGFWDKYSYIYGHALSRVIERDDLRSLILLLRFDSANIAFAQSAQSGKYHHLQEHRISLLTTASKHSLRCLKHLLDQGFYIDYHDISWNPRADPGNQRIVETVLSKAIEMGNLDFLSYVLSEGANVFGLCDTFSSAIEFAVFKGRIDSVALMLETVPACYDLALAAVEGPGYENQHMIEYVRNWKQDSGTNDSEMRGTVVEINTEGDDVAWEDFIDLETIDWSPV